MAGVSLGDTLLGSLRSMNRSKLLTITLAVLLLGAACAGGDQSRGQIPGWPGLERLANLLGVPSEARGSLADSIAVDDLEDQFNPFEGTNFAPLAEMEITRGTVFTIDDSGVLDDPALACPEGPDEDSVQVLFCTSDVTPQGRLLVLAIQTARPFPLQVEEGETMEVAVAVVNPHPAKNIKDVTDDGVNKGAQMAFGNSGSPEGPLALQWKYQPGGGTQTPDLTLRSILIEEREGTGTQALIVPVAQLLDRMDLSADPSAAPVEQIEFRLYTCYASSGQRPDITYDRVDVTGGALAQPVA
jgi:hypothetical protein